MKFWSRKGKRTAKTPQKAKAEKKAAKSGSIKILSFKKAVRDKHAKMWSDNKSVKNKSMKIWSVKKVTKKETKKVGDVAEEILSEDALLPLFTKAKQPTRNHQKIIDFETLQTWYNESNQSKAVGAEVIPGSYTKKQQNLKFLIQ